MGPIVISILAVIIFLFTYWKKLKDDYSSSTIFSSAFLTLTGIFAGFFISLKFFGVWVFWTSFAGMVLGFIVSVVKFKIRIYETLEAAIISFLPILSLFFLTDSVDNSSITSFSAFLVTLFLIFIYWFLNLRYREFAWYKSGRVGFSGLATLGILFLIRSGVAIFFTGVLSFVGKAEVFLSGVGAFGSFLLIYNLSKNES